MTATTESRIAGLSRSQLLARKRDIIAALRQIEADHRDGLIDDGAFAASVRRCEDEAAEILERLDALPLEGETSEVRRRAPVVSWSPRSALVAGMAVLAALAIGLFLVNATARRGVGGTVTGSVPPASGSVPRVDSPAIRAAERSLQKHPRSLSALLRLGNAYLQAGDSGDADHVYETAMRMAPADPEPKVLHAMVLGSTGDTAQGLSVLHGVERSKPTYARAWLLDGLLETHVRGGYGRAVIAWKHFLRLQPNAPVSPTVRQWVAAAERGRKATRGHR